MKEGLEEARKALELDPLSPSINLNIGSAYLNTGDLDLAEKQIRRALELEPSYDGGFEVLMLLAVERRSYPEAISILEKMRSMFPFGENKSKISIAYVYARSGNVDKAKQVFEDAVKTADTGSFTSIDLARYYVAVKDWDRAFEMLDHAFEKHDAELCTVGMDPWLRELSADPRFGDFLRKMNVR